MKPNTKEVVVELVEKTTSRVRKKIRFEEDIDFENPSESLQILLAKEFLHPNRGVRPSVERTMTILHDEDLEDYRYRDAGYWDGDRKLPAYDELVYMKSDYDGIPKPKLAPWGHLSEYNIQSVLVFGRIQDSNSGSYFFDYDHDGFDMFFSEKKEDLVGLWEDKKIKQLLDSQVWNEETRYQLTKVFDFFEKGIPTKSMTNDHSLHGGSGTYIAVLGDMDDYRKFNFHPRNTILLSLREYENKEVA